MPKVSVDILGDASGLTRAYRQAAVATGAFGKEVDALTGRVKGIHSSLLGMSAALVGGGGIALGFKSTVDAARKFQDAMEQVHTQAGASQKEVARLSVEVRKLGPAVGQTPENLAAGLYHVESAGLRGAKAMQVLATAAKGAAVGHADLESVTNALVAAQKSGIQGVQNMNQAMGALNAIVGVGNMRMDDLASALSTGILPAARSVGLPLKDVGAALATMTDAGVPAEAAATRLRMTFSLMAAPTKQAQQALEAIGISQTQLAHTMRTEGLVAALELLKTKLAESGATADQQSIIIARAFGGGRTSSSIITLLQQLDNVKAKEEAIGAGASGFGEKWAAEQKTAQFASERFHAALNALQIEIGTVLLPVITSAITKLADWMQRLNESGDAAKYTKETVSTLKGLVHDFTPVVKDAAAAFKTFSDNVGGTKTAIELLVGAWATWKLVSKFDALTASAGQKGAAGAVGKLATNLNTLKGVGVVTVGIELAIHSQQLKDFTQKMLDKVGLGFLGGIVNFDLRDAAHAVGIGGGGGGGGAGTAGTSFNPSIYAGNSVYGAGTALAPAMAGRSGFFNPVPGASYARIDQGVDYVARSNVLAAAAGVISSITKGMAGGTGDIIKETLDRAIKIGGRTYSGIYYSEQKPLVKQGQRVIPGMPVMGPGGNEIGFLDARGRMAPLIGGLGAGTQPTQAGRDFNAFIKSLGGPGAASVLVSAAPHAAAATAAGSKPSQSVLDFLAGKKKKGSTAFHLGLPTDISGAFSFAGAPPGIFPGAGFGLLGIPSSSADLSGAFDFAGKTGKSSLISSLFPGAKVGKTLAESAFSASNVGKFLFGISATVADNMNTVLKQKLAAQKKVWQDHIKALQATATLAKGNFTRAFGDLADAALNAFDRATSDHLKELEGSRAALTPAEQQLQQMQDAHDQQALEQQLFDDQQAGDAKAVAEDMYQIQVRALQKQADAERAARDADYAAQEQNYSDQRDLQKQQFQTELANLQAQIIAKHETVAQANSDILKLMSDFGLDPTWFTSGSNAGTALIQGLASAFRNVGSDLSTFDQASAAVSAAKASKPAGTSASTFNLGLASGAGFLGLAGVPKLATGGFITGSGLAYLHKGESVVPSGMGGGTVVNVNIATAYGDPGDFARAIRKELSLMERRGTKLGFAGA